MDMTEYVKQIMREEDVTQVELGRRLGMSRQAIFDALSRPNPSYTTIRRIMDALGRKVEVKRKDGKEIEFDINSLYEVLDSEAPALGKINKIIETMGYELIWVKK